jgi:signal recognition particle subunit SRP54
MKKMGQKGGMQKMMRGMGALMGGGGMPPMPPPGGLRRR